MSGYVGTGIRYQTPGQDTLDKRLAAADHPGEHLWVVIATWRVTDPERLEGFLDGENLVVLTGVGCMKCEGVYSRKLARRPCRGSVDGLMP